MKKILLPVSILVLVIGSVVFFRLKFPEKKYINVVSAPKAGIKVDLKLVNPFGNVEKKPEVPEAECIKLDFTIQKYDFCNKTTLKYENQVIVANIVSYSLSPNKDWLFIVGHTDDFIKQGGGAPDEYKVVMVDVATGGVIELFSQIYGVSYTGNAASWSSDSKGVVFTAGPGAKPLSLDDSAPFSVVYCTTVCKVLARDAGPEGVGALPAFFVDGRLSYVNKAGNEVFVDLIK